MLEEVKDAVPILHSVREAGTPYGYSYYSGWATCGMRATLDAAAREEGGDSSSASKATAIGWMLHLLMEYYYSGQISQVGPFAVEFSQDSGVTIDDDYWNEAKRLFEAYRQNFAPDELGEVVSVEEKIGDPEDDEEIGRIVGAEVGIYPYTCRTDLCV